MLGDLDPKKQGHFEDRITTQVVASNILAIASHFTIVQKPPQVREIQQEPIDKSFPWGYFDKDAQGDPICCGAGVVLFLIEDHFYRLKWGLGVGTNNKVELASLYMLLIFAHEKGLPRLQIFGYSMIVINSLNNAQRCLNMQLTSILEEVTQLKSIFNLITFRHIYREQMQRRIDAPRKLWDYINHHGIQKSMGQMGPINFIIGLLWKIHTLQIYNWFSYNHDSLFL